MTIGELKKLIEQYDDNLPVKMSYGMICCGGHPEGEYCYCSMTCQESDVYGVSKELNKKKETIGVIITS